MNNVKNYFRDIVQILAISCVISGIIIAAGIFLPLPEDSRTLTEKYEEIDFLEYNRGTVQTHAKEICACLQNTHRQTENFSAPAAREHLQDSIQPSLYCIRRYLTEVELLGIVLFIDEFGNETFENSLLLECLNDDRPAAECAAAIAAYPENSGIPETNLKRRWLYGAVFLGHISARQFAALPLNRLSEISLTEIYEQHPSALDGMFQPRYAPAVLQKVLNLSI